MLGRSGFLSPRITPAICHDRVIHEDLATAVFCVDRGVKLAIGAFLLLACVACLFWKLLRIDFGAVVFIAHALGQRIRFAERFLLISKSQ